MLLNMFPGQLPPAFPPSEEALAVVLGKFKTKQELENGWAERNTGAFSKKLKGLGRELSMNIGNVISRYAVTWIDV
jgi:hypothetical protein